MQHCKEKRPSSENPSLRSLALAFGRDVRLRRIFLLGLASGFPWLLIGSAMTAWLKDEGLTRSAITLFGAVFVVYTVNFLWAPLVDHVRLPGLHRLGHRRSWIVLCQAMMIGLTVLLAVSGPALSLWLTAALALGIAISSATQDLAIDAYRITIIGEDEPELIGHGAAMATCGWWTGNLLPGTVAFWLVAPLGWPLVYLLLTGVIAAIMALVVFLFREPATTARSSTWKGASWREWLERTYIDAVAEFFRRNGVALAFGLLAFIFLFKVGEAFLGRTVILFYKEVGFSDADIGTYSKGLGWFVIVPCSIAAGIFAGRFGVVRGLLFAGVAMAATNLLFSWIAVAGPDTRLFSLAVIADGITSAFSTVAFVTFISYYTSRLHTAAQYGALASLGNSSRTLLAASSGMVVDGLGGDWALFFVLTAVMVLPSLAVLVWIARRVAVKVPSGSG
ncbi:MAG: AmpG family muropeptide MFS transporter [Gammaproteobacteria bacterium]|nr:AmpG family muropeptide MFS transporter [Gammaproteobacteria bacterium]MYB37692.1 AmpG family muropeptide MFS transporter [Gammaproteobacteria bacterium]